MAGDVARSAETSGDTELSPEEIQCAINNLPIAAPLTLGAYQFVEGLLRASLDRPDQRYFERKEVGAFVGRDDVKSRRAYWCDNDAVERFMKTYAARLSDSFDPGRLVALEIDDSGSRHRFRLYAKQKQLASFRLLGSVLRYETQANTPRLNILGRLKYPGVSSGEPTEYKKWLFLLPYFATLVLIVCGMATVWFLMTFQVYKTLPQAFQVILFTSITGYLIWAAKKNWHDLLEDKVMLIPDTLLKDEDFGAVLERTSRGEERFVRIRRYTADCPICGDAKVVLANGSYDLKGRIVGRCRESPKEHVFSFDRVTLEGAPLLAINAN